MPNDLQAKQFKVSVASLPWHFRGHGMEEKASQSYVPSKPGGDDALQTALGLLRGAKVNPDFYPQKHRSR